MTTSDNLKFDFFGQGNSDLLNIFTNKNTVNSILPFGLHIDGGVSTCVTKCGHSLNNCDNIQIENVINYGKILVMKPKSKDSELILNYDARNENANSDGSGTYKLKYICFTCPSLIKIGDIDSDMQSYLIYTNDQGLYTVLCTLYRNNQPYDNLSNKLLSGMINNNIPEIGRSTTGSSLGVSSINIADFFPQDKQDYYEFVNTEKNSGDIKNNILVKVFAKKLNISSSAINNLKEKLYDSRSNLKFVNFNDSLNSTFSVKPENLNIFYVPDLGISNICGTKEKMKNLEENVITEENENEVEEEEISVIDKLTKANLEEKKEKYINFDGDIKIYAIDINTGAVKRVGSGNNEKDQVYKNLEELLVQNKNYEEDEIKKAINEFPNYIYQNAYWRLDYKVRLYKVKNQDEDDPTDSSFKIEDVKDLDDAVIKIGNTNNKDVFYAMKNFPNYPINDYYVSYYYTTDNTETSYVVIMYLILCTLILLFNYVFYRYIFFVTNKDYGEISITDEEIISDDNFKQLASWRILINIFFVLQIISTIIFCIIKLNDLNHSIKPYSNLFITMSSLTLFCSLGYAYLRLQYKDERVSYAESKSLTLLVEKSDENDNQNDVGFIKYVLNVFQLIKNNLFYAEEDDGLQELYNKLTNAKDELLSSTDENIESKIDNLTKNVDEILEGLEKYTENINNNDKTTSQFQKNRAKWYKYVFDKTIGKISEKTGLGNRGSVKKRAQDKLKQIKKLIQSISDNNNKEESKSNNNKEESSQEGGSNMVPPIVVGMKKSEQNKDGYETNRILNGKEYWPDGNYLENEYSSIEKSDIWENFMEIITFKNLLISIVILILFSFLTSKVIDIIRTFDTTEKKYYKYYSLILYWISALIYYGSICIPVFTKLFIWGYNYFLSEESREKSSNPSGSTLGKIFFVVAFIVYSIIIWYNMDPVPNSTSETFFWIFISIYSVIILGYSAYQKQKFTSSYTLMGLAFVSLLFIIFYPIIFSGAKNKKIDLILALPIVAGYIYYLMNSDTITSTIGNLSDPITFPNAEFMNNNNNENKIKEPLTIPEVGKLKEIHDAITTLQSKGGNYKKKIDNLSKHKEYLLDLSEYFDSINDHKNKEMVDKITSEIDVLT